MHYIHLGRVGLVANFRWGEIANFIVGWTSFDFIDNTPRNTGESGGTPAPLIQ